MNISKRFIEISGCVAFAAFIALAGGCSAVEPQYSETSAATSTAAQPVVGQSVAGARKVANANDSSVAAGKGEQPSGVTGVWQGELRTICNEVMMLDATRCGAVNTITFTLLQKANRVGGYYRCSFGNMDCLNMNETGRVAWGEMGTKLLRMRVMMPDGSDCLYNGWQTGDLIQGSYMCLQGGGLIEKGLWKARRSY